MAAPLYDRIGAGYAARRQPDPRIARAILEALGDAASVVNLGAGAGSYEPADRPVVAVEPSFGMIGQRAAGSAPVVGAVVERLPFRDGAFDAALAVLTVHHWADRAAGLREMRRVARRRAVVLTWDPAHGDGFWLTAEYLPEILRLDRPRFPPLDDLARALGPSVVRPLAIPHDCADGFLGAFWRRPHAYLDPRVRQAMSGFAQLDPSLVDQRIAALADDLGSGRWRERHAALLGRTELDLGYRLVVAER